MLDSKPAYRALILDRDGTLIEHIPYLSDWRLVSLLPGVKAGLADLYRHGVLLFLHTNQSGVGRKLFSLEEAVLCNQRMIDLIDLGDDVFRSVCVACEAPNEVAVYRKPEPRFAFEVMRNFGLRPDEICYVGDRGSDLETAARAGTAGIGVATGLDDLKEELRRLGLGNNFPVVRGFEQVVDYVLRNRPDGQIENENRSKS